VSAGNIIVSENLRKGQSSLVQPRRTISTFLFLLFLSLDILFLTPLVDFSKKDMATADGGVLARGLSLEILMSRMHVVVCFRTLDLLHSKM
jgi:hypothetical protein